MDLLKGELGSSDKSCVAATANMQCEMVSHVTEEGDQEATTIPSIKTEPSDSGVPVVSITQISYMICPELPAPISFCHCGRKF